MVDDSKKDGYDQSGINESSYCVAGFSCTVFRYLQNVVIEKCLVMGRVGLLILYNYVQLLFVVGSGRRYLMFLMSRRPFVSVIS